MFSKQHSHHNKSGHCLHRRMPRVVTCFQVWQLAIIWNRQVSGGRLYTAHCLLPLVFCVFSVPSEVNASSGAWERQRSNADSTEGSERSEAQRNVLPVN